jgi:hypothetical protein
MTKNNQLLGINIWKREVKVLGEKGLKSVLSLNQIAGKFVFL